MKKNKNFLMWTVLFALFTVTLHSVADTSKNAYYVPVPSLYWSGGWDGEWSNKDSVIIVETTPPNFVNTVKEYTAVVPYDAKYLRLHVKWDSVGPRSSVDTLQAIVKNGNERIWADSEKSSATSVFDSVYSVPFKSKTDYDINGTFGFDLPSALGGGTKSYSLKISRVQASTVSTLKYLTVAYTKVAEPNGESWKTAFEFVKTEAAGDSILLHEYDASKPVLSGRYVAPDSVDAGDKVALRLEKTGPLSTVSVKQKGEDIPVAFTPWGETHPVYEIAPDAQVEIKVTAQDGITDSTYWIVVYSRPVVEVIPGGAKLDSVSTGIPHFGGLWLQDADDNYYKTDFDTTNQMSVGVHKLDLKASVPAGVNLFVGYTWRADSVGKAANDSIWTVYSNGSVQAYPAGDTAFIVRLLNNKGGLLKTYTIALKHPDYSLSRFILSEDAAGDTPLEPDSEGRYTVEFDVDSVYLSFAANDTSFVKSDNFDVVALKKVGRDITPNDAKGYEHKYKLGLEEAGLSRTFLFTVKDGNNSKKYTVVVKRKIDFSLKSFSLKIGDTTVAVDPEKIEDVKVPATVNFVDIEVEAEPVSDLVTAVKSVVGTDGSYVARVRVYVKGRADEGEKEYKVSLLSPSGVASLKRLLVTPGELTPAFDSETYEYSVSVPHEQNFIYFVTEPSNEYADVSGNGEQELEVGENPFTVTVIAEDGTEKEYHITVFRADGDTGILPLSASSAQVYVSGEVLHVSAPLAERVDVYTASGSLLYSLDKPAGKVSLQGLPKGILIVKGGSGWVRKVAI